MWVRRMWLLKTHPASTRRPYLSDEKFRETYHPRESQKALESFIIIRAPSESYPRAVRPPSDRRPMIRVIGVATLPLVSFFEGSAGVGQFRARASSRALASAASERRFPRAARPWLAMAAWK